MATTEKESSSKESVVQKIDEGNIKIKESKEIHENDSTEEATCIKNYKAKDDNQCEDCEMFYDAMEYNSCQSENKTERFSDSSQKNSPSEHQTDSSEVIRDAQEQNEPAEEKTEEDEIEKEIESQEDLTPQQKEERKIEAKKYKDQGNECFRKCEYPEAKELYTRSIRICPNEFKEEKAVFYANRAACLVKMDLQKDAIEDCTKALDLNDKYLKARLRRAQCYEHVEKLEEALEDYQKVFEQDSSSPVAREALMRLPEEIKIKHEKMKEEMIGKLKDLGNVFLKPFGLSTNNFKLQQDPSSGGYTINFQK